jgi:PAS domain S-box-containing protein
LDVGEIRESTKASIKAQALASGQQIYWAGVMPNVNQASNYADVLTAAHLITVTDHRSLKKRPLAILMVNYSIDHISQYLSEVDLESSVTVVLLDQHGNTIYNKDSEKTGRLPKGFVTQLMKDDHLPEMVTWNDQSFIIHSQPLENFGWQLISITPEDVLLKGMKTIREVTVWLLLISFLVVGLSAWIFSRNIVQPIRDVIKGYKNLHNGVFDTTRRLLVRSNDEIGELVQWYNSFLDNIASKQASEAALRVSEERYALVVNATHEGLWDWNIESNKMYFSPRFFSLLGLDPLYVNILNVPEEWFDRIHSDDQSLVKHEVNNHLAGHTEFFKCEHRLLHEDGTYHWILSHGLAVRDETGKALRMAGSHTDITDRKEAESKLRHFAYHDSLTGLKNRAWFVNHLLKVLHSQRNKSNSIFAVLFLDLDLRCPQ